MLQSENINELITALSKAQGKIKPAAKNKKNPHFRSLYADLDSIWEACRSALSESGLAVVQTISHNEKGMILVTTLGHVSGQWIRSEMPVVLQKHDPQGIGSALTYYRRYTLAAIVGVAPGEDDDAEDATVREEHKTNGKDPITKEQHDSLVKLLKGDIEKTQKICSGLGIEKLSEMRQDAYEKIITWIEDKKKQ